MQGSVGLPRMPLENIFLEKAHERATLPYTPTRIRDSISECQFAQTKEDPLHHAKMVPHPEVLQISFVCRFLLVVGMNLR